MKIIDFISNINFGSNLVLLYYNRKSPYQVIYEKIEDEAMKRILYEII